MAGLSRVRRAISSYVRPDESSGTTKWQVKYGGLVLAALGFALTRLAVLPFLHVDVSFRQFIIGQLLPLVVGLGIIVLGIGLAFSTLPRTYVNTITAWSLFATVGMGAVAGITVLQVSLYLSIPSSGSVWTNALFANTLLAGAMGGILVGVHSANNKRTRRELSRQSGQLTLLNRLLRHKVLNKVTIIRGYAKQIEVDEGHVDANGNANAVRVIENSVDRIESTIEDVGFLTRLQAREKSSIGPVDLVEILREEIQTARERHPYATFDTGDPSATPSEICVQADSHVRAVFRELLDNAVEHTESSSPEVSVHVLAKETHVEVRIRDNGPGLPPGQRDIVERGTLPTYDDPSTGFGLPLARVLVSQYDGSMDVEEVPDGSGTTITVALPRATDETQNVRSSVRPGIAPRQLGFAILAALVAGAVMGGILQGLSGVLPAVGGLYGIRSLGAGWILHLFHSSIFGVLFAVLLSQSRFGQYATTVKRHATMGVGYGVLLWAVAAGIVMPVWLNVVGIPAPVPQLTPTSLVGHVTWGFVLGGLYGYLSR